MWWGQDWHLEHDSPRVFLDADNIVTHVYRTQACRERENKDKLVPDARDCAVYMPILDFPEI